MQTETYQPGQITIRPTRTEAEGNPDVFYDLLSHIRNLEALPLRKLAEVSGDTSNNPAINFWKALRARRLNDEQRSIILRHIFEEAMLLFGRLRRKVAEIDDALYFALLNFVRAKDTSQDNARAHVVGTYKLWRHSVDDADEFVFGKLHFFEDPSNRALRAEMVQPKRSLYGIRSSNEQFSGYLFRVGEKYVMLLGDPRVGEVRMTIFDHPRRDDVGQQVNPRSVFTGCQTHIVQMDGLGVGIDGGRVFSSPVHISLVDDVDELARLDAELDVVPEGDPRIPPRVVKKLRQHGPLRRL